jgi:hypothetical protein
MRKTSLLQKLRRHLGLAAVTGALLGAGTTTAVAAPFANDDLLTGHTIKPSSKDRHFAAGAKFQIAPVKAIEKKLATKAIDSAVAKNPQIKPVVEYLKYVDTAQLKALAASGKIDQIKAMAKEQMQAQGKWTPAAEQAFNQLTPSNVQTMAEVLDAYNSPQQALAFSVDPYAELNVSIVQLRAQIAVAGWNSDSGNHFALGNAGLGVALGDAYGVNSAAFGWTVGVDVWAPTGTADSDTIALSNILAAPRYLHSYFTYAPYGVVGVDLPVVDVMLRGQYIDMTPMRDKAADLYRDALQHQAYLDLGLAAVADLGMMGISLEIDHLSEIEHAPLMKNVWLGTLGARAFLGPLQLAGGVQVPLTKPTPGGHAVDGVGFGELASVNFLLNAQVKF